MREKSRITEKVVILGMQNWKRVICLVFGVTLLANLSVQSQQVVAVSGSDMRTGTVSLNWTIGEPLTRTLRSEEYILTPGFHQGFRGVNAIQEELPVSDQILVYPNPVLDRLTIETQGDFRSGLVVEIMDVYGRRVLTSHQEESGGTIDLSFLSAGVYHIRFVGKKSNSVHSVGIIKL